MNLTIIQPAFVGRDVKLQLFIENGLNLSFSKENMEMRVKLHNESHFKVIESYRIQDVTIAAVTMILINVNKSWNMAHVQVNCSGMVSNTGQLILQSQPELSPFCLPDVCASCLCVYPGDSPRCETSGTNVSLLLDGHLIAIKSDGHIYTARDIAITDGDHQREIDCTASFADSLVTFSAKATVFVILPPAFSTLHISELREGAPSNVTCVASHGRPPPKLRMYLDEDMVNGSNQVDRYDIQSQTYSSIISLTSVDRAWNKKVLKCTCLVLGKGLEYVPHSSATGIVDYQYPPSMVQLFITKTPAKSPFLYSARVECLAHDFNAVCSIDWTSDISNLKLGAQSHVSNTSAASKVQLDVSAEMEGRQIGCRVHCGEFDADITNYLILGDTSDTNSSSGNFFLMSLVLTIAAELVTLMFCGLLIYCIVSKCNQCRRESKKITQYTLPGDVESEQEQYRDNMHSQENTNQDYRAIEENQQGATGASQVQPAGRKDTNMPENFVNSTQMEATEIQDTALPEPADDIYMNDPYYIDVEESLEEYVNDIQRPTSELYVNITYKVGIQQPSEDDIYANGPDQQ
ncbi:uncharacterized protein LOC127871882 isoform X2 [Dreissena polymorpha]|nr:uncharacterized protein LOC127871882 isoform X2 [Dreissena polymorpha]